MTVQLSAKQQQILNAISNGRARRRLMQGDNRVEHLRKISKEAVKSRMKTIRAKRIYTKSDEKPFNKPVRSEDEIRKDLSEMIGQQLQLQFQRWGFV
jgi:hypothetical protein